MCYRCVIGVLQVGYRCVTKEASAPLACCDQCLGCMTAGIDADRQHCLLSLLANCRTKVENKLAELGTYNTCCNTCC